MQWYNNERLHSALEYKTPAEKELEIRLKNYKKVLRNLHQIYWVVKYLLLPLISLPFVWSKIKLCFLRLLLW